MRRDGKISCSAALAWRALLYHDINKLEHLINLRQVVRSSLNNILLIDDFAYHKPCRLAATAPPVWVEGQQRPCFASTSVSPPGTTSRSSRSPPSSVFSPATPR